MRRFVIAALALWLVTTGAGRATFITEYFNGYGSAGREDLDGLSGGDGWFSAWVNSAGNDPGYDANQTSFSNPDYAATGNGTAGTDGRCLIAPGDAPGNIIRRSFSTPLSGTVWLSFIVRHSSTSAGDFLFWFETVTSGSQANTFVGLRNGDVPNLRYQGAVTTAADTGEVSTPLLFLVKVGINAAGPADSIECWIKREADDLSSEAALGAPLLAAAGVDVFGDSLDYIGISGGTQTSNLDSLRISNGANALREVLTHEPRQAIFATTFPDPQGSMPAGWRVDSGTEGAPGWYMDSGDYRFGQAATTGISVYTGAMNDKHQSGDLGDVQLQATFRKGADAAICGLVARYQNTGNFYHARLQGTSAFHIYRFFGGSPVQLASATASSSYVGGETWTIRMSLSGSTIYASLWNAAGTMVARINATDGTFTSGSCGLRCQSPAVYESVTVSAPLDPVQGSVFAVR